MFLYTHHSSRKLFFATDVENYRKKIHKQAEHINVELIPKSYFSNTTLPPKPQGTLKNRGQKYSTSPRIEEFAVRFFFNLVMSKATPTNPYQHDWLNFR